ncbi:MULTISPECIES: MCE family protein [unclassified Mycobacterium]|uniref:MCE family protein n=1 Tax=unclassified Mycobacterium TaxID=2642494 RepID=UPI0029C998F5|nr:MULTISPECIES: MCE family protein [unclassified Mycobacterium]
MDKIKHFLHRPIEQYGALRLGIITVVAIVVTLATALGLSSIGIGKTSYQAEFAQAAGLSDGDLVTVAGIHIGAVEGVALHGDRVLVTMKLQDDVHIGDQTQASIKMTTLLGSRYVELRPAGAKDLPNRRIPLSNTVVPYDLQQTLQDATTTFEAVDAEKIAQSLTTLADQVKGTPEILPEALRNVERLASVISGRRDQVGALLTSSEQITGLLGRQQQSLGVLVRQGHEVVGDLAARRQLIVRLIDATTKLVNQLQPILVGDRHQIDELLANLNGMLQSLGKNDALFRSMLQMTPVPLRNFANATGSGNEFDFTSSGGELLDSWMCAISGRAEQFNLPTYFQDCK